MDDGRLRELNNCDDDDVLLVLFCRAVRIERGSGENMVVFLILQRGVPVDTANSTHMIMTQFDSQNKIRK